jgi:transposase
MSIAAAAMARSVNANLLRRWVVEAERAEEMTRSAVKALPAPIEAFVALPMPAKTVDKTAIRIEVRRGALTVSVHWPSSGMHECAIWLREVLK